MKDGLGQVQSILVLGGTSDIGVATAAVLARPRAARVVLAGRSAEGLERAAERVREAGSGEVTTMAFDAHDDAVTHERVIEEAWEQLGDVDVVLVAFGVLGEQDKDEHDPARAVDVTQVNYLAAVSVGIAVAERLRQQGHGVLVVLSSVAGERVRRSNFVYGATKAGLDGFAQGLGDALHGTGASVLVVRPGFVVSKMTAGMKPAPMSTTPEAVAAAIADAVAKGREVIWVPPVLRPVMSVVRHLPRAVFRKVPF